jgi:hypothetical protein
MELVLAAWIGRQNPVRQYWGQQVLGADSAPRISTDFAHGVNNDLTIVSAKIK